MLVMMLNPPGTRRAETVAKKEGRGMCSRTRVLTIACWDAGKRPGTLGIGDDEINDVGCAVLVGKQSQHASEREMLVCFC